MDEKSLAEVYIEKLESSTNKTQVMVEFYRILFQLDKIEQSTYKIMGRLISIYGYKVIFLSILDCIEVENINFDGVYRLIAYFAKKRVSEKLVENHIEDLTPMIAKNLKDLERVRKVKIPKIDWDEKDV
jgi:hypothetical protein